MPIGSDDPGTGRSTGFALLEEVASRVTTASDEAGARLEVLFLLGWEPGDAGQACVSIGLSTSRGCAYLVEDRFQACWMVLRDSGSTGTARRITGHAGTRGLADECCRFLGLVDG